MTALRRLSAWLGGDPTPPEYGPGSVAWCDDLRDVLNALRRAEELLDEQVGAEFNIDRGRRETLERRAS